MPTGCTSHSPWRDPGSDTEKVVIVSMTVRDCIDMGLPKIAFVSAYDARGPKFHAQFPLP